MTENLNATCSICGVRYHICKDCSNTKSFTPWRTIAHDINCYKIFLAIRDYTNGYVDKDETKNILSNCDLSGLDTFQDNIKKAIKDIMKETKTKKIVSKTASEDIKENDNE